MKPLHPTIEAVKRIAKGKNGQVPGPLKPDGTWDWVEPHQDEVAWLDERINVVRYLAQCAVDGTHEEMRVALTTIIQQLVGVSRTTSARKDDDG